MVINFIFLERLGLANVHIAGLKLQDMFTLCRNV